MLCTDTFSRREASVVPARLFVLIFLVCFGCCAGRGRAYFPALSPGRPWESPSRLSLHCTPKPAAGAALVLPFVFALEKNYYELPPPLLFFSRIPNTEIFFLLVEKVRRLLRSMPLVSLTLPVNVAGSQPCEIVSFFCLRSNALSFC